MDSKTLITLIEALTNDTKSGHEKHHIGKTVIVRCRDAGVHCGKLVDYYDRTAILKDSRRMWKWWAGSEHSLSGVARHGIKRSESKIAGTINEEIVLSDFCEIIPFSTTDAIHSVMESDVYNEQ